MNWLRQARETVSVPTDKAARKHCEAWHSGAHTAMWEFAHLNAEPDKHEIYAETLHALDSGANEYYRYELLELLRWCKDT